MHSMMVKHMNGLKASGNAFMYDRWTMTNWVWEVMWKNGRWDCCSGRQWGWIRGDMWKNGRWGDCWSPR